MAYELFCYSVQGSSHIKRGIPCQDYGMKFENEDCKIFVLGDGHGDSNCPRSDYGSRTLCEIAVEELKVFAKTIDVHDDLEEKLMDKYGIDELVNQLVTSIFGKWSCKVNEHFLQNPLTENEEELAKAMLPLYKRGKRIEHIYGTTFIAGVMTDNYLLLLHQGDGKCVVFGSDGTSSEPVPWDDRCVANVTTSVCDIDAVQSCRYHIIDLKKNHIIACVLGSDGIDDSFSSMQLMHSYYRGELLFAASNGIEAFEARMAETFPNISREGSGDDTTVCGVIDREEVIKHTQRFYDENEKVIVNNKIRRAQEHIISMGPKLDHLKKKCDDSNIEYSRLERSYEELKKEHDEIMADIESHERNFKTKLPGIKFLSSASIKHLKKCLTKIKQEMETIGRELQAAAVKKKACDDEYFSYKKKYDDYVNTKRECEKQLNEIGSSKGTVIGASDEAYSNDSSEDVSDTAVVAEKENTAVASLDVDSTSSGETAFPDTNGNVESTEAASTVTESIAEPTVVTSLPNDEGAEVESKEAPTAMEVDEEAESVSTEPQTAGIYSEQKDAAADIEGVVISDEAVADMVRHDSQTSTADVKEEPAVNAVDPIIITDDNAD